MPIHAYRCTAGHEFEALQTIHEEPLTSCTMIMPPDGAPCGESVTRQISKPNFSFKGGAPTPRFYDRG